MNIKRSHLVVLLLTIIVVTTLTNPFFLYDSAFNRIRYFSFIAALVVLPLLIAYILRKKAQNYSQKEQWRFLTDVALLVAVLGCEYLILFSIFFQFSTPVLASSSKIERAGPNLVFGELRHGKYRIYAGRHIIGPVYKAVAICEGINFKDVVKFEVVDASHIRCSSYQIQNPWIVPI